MLEGEVANHPTRRKQLRRWLMPTSLPPPPPPIVYAEGHGRRRRIALEIRVFPTDGWHEQAKRSRLPGLAQQSLWRRRGRWWRGRGQAATGLACCLIRLEEMAQVQEHQPVVTIVIFYFPYSL
jgi:hypothetical protein